MLVENRKGLKLKSGKKSGKKERKLTTVLEAVELEIRFLLPSFFVFPILEGPPLLTLFGDEGGEEGEESAFGDCGDCGPGCGDCEQGCG